MTKQLPALLILFILILLACSPAPVQHTGTISDVDIEITMFRGAVVDSAEKAMANVIVELYNREISDTVAVDSTISNNSGYYTFDSIKTGNYHIVAQYDDTLSAGLWNIAVDTIIDSVIIVDTLRLTNTGTITGNVENYDGYGLVTVYIPGTSYMASVDMAGHFTMSWVAPDSGYTVAFQRFGYSQIQISDVSVTANDTTILGSVSLTPNQYPRNLTALYDTTKNRVTLNWDAMDRANIDGYKIYRQDSLLSAVDMVLLNTQIVTGTEFIDELDPKLFSRTDSIVFKYQIRGVTKGFGDETGKSHPVYVDTHIERSETDIQSIEFLSPAIGEQLKGNTSYDIVWDYTGLIDSVRLLFTIDGGESWNSLSGVIENRGVYKWPAVYNTNSTECQIRVEDIANPSKLYMTELFEIIESSTDNLLKNGDFSEGIAYWSPQLLVNAKASFDVNGGVFHAEMKVLGENDWDIGLFQGPIHIQKNYLYEVNFRAKASVVRCFTANFIKMYDGGKHLVGHHDSLRTEWQEYTFPLTIFKGGDEVNGGFNFVLGCELGDVWIDDVSIKIIDEN